MGLDMFLNRTVAIEGFELEDYVKCEAVLSYEEYLNNFKPDEDRKEPCSVTEWNGLSKYDFKVYKHKARALKPFYKEKGEYFKYNSIWDEVGYWRKANQIHAWFVQNVQDGEDECERYIVSKEDLETLLDDCKEVIDIKNNKSLSIEEKEEMYKDILPTENGFFFGSTEYDEYYFEQVEETIEILNDVLSTTDFEKEIVTYISSW